MNDFPLSIQDMDVLLPMNEKPVVPQQQLRSRALSCEANAHSAHASNDVGTFWLLPANIPEKTHHYDKED